MGAVHVIAAGRNRDALEAVAQAGGPRVVPVALSGKQQNDVAALREASGGGAHMAFDMVGQARDPNSTLSATAQLAPRRSAGADGEHDSRSAAALYHRDAEQLGNLGQFMYPASAYRRLLDLLRSGLLDISAIRRAFSARGFADGDGGRSHCRQSRMYRMQP